MSSPGRPITVRDNYWSEHHNRMLWKLALQLINRSAEIKQRFQPEELVNQGWLSMARRYKDVKGRAVSIQRAMWRYTEKELRWLTRQTPQGLLQDSEEWTTGKRVL